MNFLPTKLNGNKVYAGFWKRFGASSIDALLILPFYITFYFVYRTSILVAIVSVFIYYNLIWFYSVYFNYRFGATIGKMAVGIKITFPDGTKIQLKQAFLRSAVDIMFSFFIICAFLYAISRIDSIKFNTFIGLEKSKYIFSFFPGWYSFLDTDRDVWFWSELVVLLFNKRKRAIHDYIAGTVVINDEYCRADESNVNGIKSA